MFFTAQLPEQKGRGEGKRLSFCDRLLCTREKNLSPELQTDFLLYLIMSPDSELRHLTATSFTGKVK